MVTFTDNTKGIVLIDLIKLLLDEYLETVDSTNEIDGEDVIKTLLDNCTYTSVNEYLHNFLEFTMLDLNNTYSLTRDDIDYATTIIQILKGSSVVIDFMGMMTNIDILGWETAFDSRGRVLKVHIDTIKSQYPNYIIDQFSKSLHSLIYFGQYLDLEINNIISLLYSRSENIVSVPVVTLSGNYTYYAKSIEEIL